MEDGMRLSFMDCGGAFYREGFMRWFNTSCSFSVSLEKQHELVII
jgi:hypothetical protein